MKIVELFNGLRYMITNEQKELIKLIKEQEQTQRHTLSERHQRLAEEMTAMGLIDRVYDESKDTVVYKLFKKYQ